MRVTTVLNKALNVLWAAGTNVRALQSADLTVLSLVTAPSQDAARAVAAAALAPAFGAKVSSTLEEGGYAGITALVIPPSIVGGFNGSTSPSPNTSPMATVSSAVSGGVGDPNWALAYPLAIGLGGAAALLAAALAAVWVRARRAAAAAAAAKNGALFKAPDTDEAPMDEIAPRAEAAPEPSPQVGRGRRSVAYSPPADRSDDAADVVATTHNPMFSTSRRGAVPPPPPLEEPALYSQRWVPTPQVEDAEVGEGELPPVAPQRLTGSRRGAAPPPPSPLAMAQPEAQAQGGIYEDSPALAMPFGSRRGLAPPPPPPPSALPGSRRGAAPPPPPFSPQPALMPHLTVRSFAPVPPAAAPGGVEEGGELPPGWLRLGPNAEGRYHYDHPASQRTQWERPQVALHPLQDGGAPPPPLPPGWERCGPDPATGKFWYDHPATSTTSWEPPAAPAPAPAPAPQATPAHTPAPEVPPPPALRPPRLSAAPATRPLQQQLLAALHLLSTAGAGHPGVAAAGAAAVAALTGGGGTVSERAAALDAKGATLEGAAGAAVAAGAPAALAAALDAHPHDAALAHSAATALRNIAAADEPSCRAVASAGAAAPLAAALQRHGAGDPEICRVVVGAILNLPAEHQMGGLAGAAGHLRAARAAHADHPGARAVLDEAAVRLFMGGRHH